MTMIVYSWATSGPLVRGLFPGGSDPEKFGVVDEMRLGGGQFLAQYDGDDFADFGAVEYDPAVHGPFDLRPEISLVSLTSTDPAFYYDAATGLVSANTATVIDVVATISNFPIVDKWNTPLYRNGVREGFVLTSSDGAGGLTFSLRFPTIGLWEITEAGTNEGLPPAMHFKLAQEIRAKVSTAI